MFAILLRHTGTIVQLYQTVHALNDETASNYWEKLYVVVERPLNDIHLQSMCCKRTDAVTVVQAPLREWPAVGNRLLRSVRQPWICSLESTHGRERVSSLPLFAHTARTFPQLVGIRWDTKRDAVFCWNRFALKEHGGWPLEKEWPFTHTADDYRWSTLPEELKLSAVLESEPSHSVPDISYWQWKQQEWIDSFLLGLEQRKDPHAVKRKPLISVVMSVYNEQNTIPWSLMSVLYQTMPHFELIVINDGSTDGTEKEMATFTDPRITFISHTCNRGKVHRLNEALAISKGEILYELDADDWLSPDALQWAMRSMLAQSHDVALIYGDRLYWNEDSQGQLMIRHKQCGEQVHSHAQYRQQLTPVGPRVYRRNALERVGGWPVDAYYDGRLYEDIRIVMRLLESFKVVYVPGTHYHVRMRANSVTNRHKDHFNAWKKWVRQRT